MKAGAKFCGSCGAAVENPPMIEQSRPQQYDPPNYVPPAQPNHPPSRPLSPALIVLGVFVVAAVAGIGISMGLGNRHPATETVHLTTVPLESSENLVAVPDMLGVKEAQARDMAKSKSLKLDVTTGASNNVAAGLVISQYPPAGKAIALGSTMRIRISLGMPGSAKAKSDTPTVIVVPSQSTVSTQRSNTGGSSYHVSSYAPSYNYPLTYSDLYGKSDWELDIMRNTIYAKYGRTFHRSDLQQYFNRQSWYSPNSGFYEGMLTATERRNAALIAQYQKQR